MRDAIFSGEGRVEHERAILKVTQCLREHTGGAATRIEHEAIATTYERRNLAAGWRIPVAFSDGKTRNIDLLVSHFFPRSAPRAALVDRPDQRTWPHIEYDGVLCLLPNSSEIDPTAPGEVALAILNRGVRLVEELIEGSIVERDFKQEFLTYWFYASQESGKNVVILCEPVGPSRVLRRFTWEGKVYVGEDVSSCESPRTLMGNPVPASVVFAGPFSGSGHAGSPPKALQEALRGSSLIDISPPIRGVQCPTEPCVLSPVRFAPSPSVMSGIC